jgi:hypothetical protein
VLGAIALAIAIIVVIPVSVLATGAVVAMLLGWRLKEDAEERHAGSELIELNR